MIFEGYPILYLIRSFIYLFFQLESQARLRSRITCACKHAYDYIFSAVRTFCGVIWTLDECRMIAICKPLRHGLLLLDRYQRDVTQFSQHSELELALCGHSITDTCRKASELKFSIPASTGFRDYMCLPC